MVDIDVGIADLKIAQTPDELLARGIGSCIAIILYDPLLKIGALSHTLLPHQGDKQHERPARFADTAIDHMLHQMIALGCKTQNIRAKIVGGSNMFPESGSHIGTENILSAREKLIKEGIRIDGEAVSGTVGRSIRFSTETGLVTVKMMF